MASPHTDSVKHKTLHALPWTIVARVGRFLMTFITSIIIVRMLGKEAFGTFSVVRSILIIFSTLIMFGLHQALLRQIPEVRVRFGDKYARALMSSAILIEAGVWLVCIGAVFAGQPLVADLYGADVKDYLLFGIVVIFATSLFNTISSGVTTLYATRVMATWHIIGGAGVMVLVFVALTLGFGIYGVFGAIALSNLLVFLILSYKFYSARTAQQPAEPPGESEGAASTPPGIKRLFTIALPFFLISIMSYIAWKQSEVLFIGHFVGKTEAGFFDIGYGLSEMIINFIPLSLFPLMLTAYSEAYTRDPKTITESMVLHYKLLFLIVAPLMIGGVMFGDKAITIIYSQEMAPGGPLCRIFFFVQTLAFWGAPLSLAIYSIGKTWWNFVFYFITTVVILTCDYFFIKEFGLYGAIVGTTVGVSLSPFLRYFMLRTVVHHIVIPWKFNLKCLFAAAMALPLLLVRPYITTFPVLVLAGILTVAIYFLFLKMYRVLTGDVLHFIRMSRLPYKDTISRLLG